ncbi:hypothetical protein Trydic_g16513 [Trypoxylus dichotomus]
MDRIISNKERNSKGHGLSLRIISENGTQFVSRVMHGMAHILGIRQSLIATYQAEANPAEIKNRDLKPQLITLVGKDHAVWDTKLPAIRFALNSDACHSTGYSQSYLTFGREMRTPYDVCHDLRLVIAADIFVPLIHHIRNY